MSKLSPIWVEHPETGRQINVAPLLSALDQFDAEPDYPTSSGARDVIRKTIRTLNVTVHDPQINQPKDLANLYQDLHFLEDAFEAMTERNPPDE